LEIYNEQVIDLLGNNEKTDKEKSEPLLILEDPIKGICIPDITQHKITNVYQVLNLIMLGNSRRTMASTSANQFSSRSHAILELNIEQINLRNETSLSSKLSLVDLAGSERGAVEKGVRREEGANINKSLLALGNCINILSDKNKKNSFVPYRDSKLTRLLKDSLGGNISTIMIACISPNFSTFDETLNTLKYASRARKIQKKIMINKNDNFNSDLKGYKEVIENLRNEVEQLKKVIE
jgi:kinesin family protein 18/19